MDRALNSFIGVVAPLMGVITSFQESVEWTLRVTSLVIGVAIGLISLFRLIRKF